VSGAVVTLAPAAWPRPGGQHPVLGRPGTLL